MQLFPTAVIGSLPRPTFVRDLTVRDTDLSTPPNPEHERALEAAIRYAVALQEQAGINVITDGEWRRATFFDVLAKIATGFKLAQDPLAPKLRTFTVVEPMHVVAPGFLAREVRFLRSITKREIKATLPSPALLGERLWHPTLSKEAYSTREAFIQASIPLLRQELVLAVKAGATRIQIDDPHLCLFVDPSVRAQYADPDAALDAVIRSINAVVDGVDAHVGVHLCRRAGARSTGARTFVGGFDVLIPHLNRLKVQELALEFTAPGAGDVAVLRALRPDIVVGLGCVSVHHGQIDDVETIVRRAEEALKYIEKDRLILTPDCGFAPSATAIVSLDEVYEKLCNLSSAAQVLRDTYR